MANAPTSGDDDLYGDDASNSIGGLDGRDFIWGGGGYDVLSGDAGNDSLAGGADQDILLGGTGYDFAFYGYATAGVTASLITNQGFVTSLGTADTDFFTGLEGIVGSSHSDSLEGNRGANRLSGLGGFDTMEGGGGNDTIDGHSGNDELSGGNGDDLLRPGTGLNQLIGGLGSDTVSYDDATGVVAASLMGHYGSTIGELPTDTDEFQGIENLTGSDFDDVLTGDGNANVLTGLGGDDTLDGSGGNDTLLGGAGDDTFIAGAGHEHIDGGLGALEFNTVDYSHSNARVTVNLATKFGQGGYAEGDELLHITQIDGSQFGDQLTGNAGANSLFGGGGSDTIAGGNGSDYMEGGSGIDNMSGGKGFDWFVGGAGADTLTGGDGADTFMFNSFTESRANPALRDTIVDFTHGEDQVMLQFDADIVNDGFQPFLWRGESSFSGSAGELRFEKTAHDTIIQGDIDGDAHADFAILLNGHVNLRDFDII